MPARAIGRTKSGIFCRRSSGGRRPGDRRLRRRAAGLARAGHLLHHAGERTLRDRRPARGPICTPSDVHDLGLERVGEHRDPLRALGTLVDDRERAAIGRRHLDELHRLDRRARRGTSSSTSRSGAELVGDRVDRARGDGAASPSASGRRRDRRPRPELGIERHRAEAAAGRGRSRRRAGKSGRTVVAAGAVVAAHVLDVAEDAVRRRPHRGDGARHDAARDVGRESSPARRPRPSPRNSAYWNVRSAPGGRSTSRKSSAPQATPASRSPNAENSRVARQT